MNEGRDAMGGPGGTPDARKPLLRQVAGQWPLAVVLAGVVVGLVVVAFGHWRLGCTGVGAAITLGGVLRLALGERAGLLAVRRAAVDVVLLLGVGVGIVVMAWLVSPMRER